MKKRGQNEQISTRRKEIRLPHGFVSSGRLLPRVGPCYDVVSIVFCRRSFSSPFFDIRSKLKLGCPLGLSSEKKRTEEKNSALNLFRVCSCLGDPFFFSALVMCCAFSDM